MDRLAIASLKPSELTWETALRLFALRNRSQNIAAGTQELYGQHLSRFREWVRQNGNTTPAQITTSSIHAQARAAGESRSGYIAQLTLEGRRDSRG